MIAVVNDVSFRYPFVTVDLAIESMHHFHREDRIRSITVLWKYCDKWGDGIC